MQSQTQTDTQTHAHTHGEFDKGLAAAMLIKDDFNLYCVGDL